MFFRFISYNYKYREKTVMTKTKKFTNLSDSNNDNNTNNDFFDDSLFDDQYLTYDSELVNSSNSAAVKGKTKIQNKQVLTNNLPKIAEEVNLIPQDRQLVYVSDGRNCDLTEYDEIEE